MSKEIFEGFFMIPFQGQIRFSVSIVDRQVVFDDPNHNCDYLFKVSSVTTHDYHVDTDNPRHRQTATEVMTARRGYLHEQSKDIKSFILDSKSKTLKTEPKVVIKYLGKQYTETCQLTVVRINLIN